MSSRVYEEKLAIVTGSSRGIGAAIAQNLASKGCNVVVNYTSEASDVIAQKVASELERMYGVVALPFRADITSREECEGLVSAVRERFTHADSGLFQIDILVHNAAIAYLGPVETVKEAEFRRIYEVNVLGPVLLTGICKPYLPTDRSGRIVMLSSINSKVGTENTTLYSGTKGAVEAMTRVWARELAEQATVNAINPGAVSTGQYLAAPDDIKEILGRWNPLTPLASVRDDLDTPEIQDTGKRFGGRAAYPEEIAGLVASICHPEFGWCTGSIISANGGLSFSI
ncbi:unnamed protein product [Penicillium salamii]|uniref:Uncharacterized protein n=1 Tax=Penicillium salamii TaxID=1612424 RepID=A0A9W4K410_9EURO|nr:unnamed protein product [Penicillium salamii]CAG8126290.1 unnamed protein product [Penicillium salamii]CAG8150803.1 unnamed protein product [Penicillium salamii]CAG8156927.1 unnamed protein product [Penicillium salamii]CAG8159534.1 unnamed protein product [Penicillium salamii]